MATIKDIARETGLGLATISKYLNGGTVLDKNKAAIEAAIHNSGYTVNELARGLKTSRSKSIGVVIPELSNVFIATIITVVADILRKHGYSILICDCRTDEAEEKEAIRFLLRKRVDGIINMPVSGDGSHLEGAIARGIPVVLIDRMIDALKNKVHAVLVDNVAASSNAVSTLIEHGHRSIGIILGPDGIFTSNQRLRGYTQAIERNGLSLDNNLIVNSDYTVQGGYESMRRLLSYEALTSVFVTNYEMTLGAVIAINELSVSIPEQLSFIGFDNQQLFRAVRPRLNIVTQPLEEIGMAAAEILLDALEAGADLENKRKITLTTGLLAGDSIKHI